MKPQGTRVWRKAARRAVRGSATGRRTSHRVYISGPQPRSTWLQRHPGGLGYWLANAGKRRLDPNRIRTETTSETT